MVTYVLKTKAFFKLHRILYSRVRLFRLNWKEILLLPIENVVLLIIHPPYCTACIYCRQAERRIFVWDGKVYWEKWFFPAGEWLGGVVVQYPEDAAPFHYSKNTFKWFYPGGEWLGGVVVVQYPEDAAPFHYDKNTFQTMSQKS